MKALPFKSLRIFCFILVTAVFAAGSALAQVPAPTPCDSNYYDSLESRAWLEAQREITQNQNLIFKPDSVLQYTCFDRFLDHLANEEPNLFSSGTKWPGASTGGTNMTAALQNLVGAVVSSYLTGNFNHPMLGGQLTTVTYAGAAVSVNPASYTCGMMNSVWQNTTGTAKCRDFIQDPGFDGFFTFAEYQVAVPDKRHLPAACNPIPNRWLQEINTASVPASTPWTEDNVVTYLNRMDPANCGAGFNPPILTGLTVVRNQTPNNYPEKVCVTPGCIYNPSAGPGGSCQ